MILGFLQFTVTLGRIKKLTTEVKHKKSLYIYIIYFLFIFKNINIGALTIFPLGDLLSNKSTLAVNLQQQDHLQ